MISPLHPHQIPAQCVRMDTPHAHGFQARRASTLSESQIMSMTTQQVEKEGSSETHKRPLEVDDGDPIQAKERKLDSLTGTLLSYPSFFHTVNTQKLRNNTTIIYSLLAPYHPQLPSYILPEPSLNSVLFGLPKFMDQKQLNKLLASHSVVCKKAKKTPRQDFAFLYFEVLHRFPLSHSYLLSFTSFPPSSNNLHISRQWSKRKKQQTN